MASRLELIQFEDVDIIKHIGSGTFSNVYRATIRSRNECFYNEDENHLSSYHNNNKDNNESFNSLESSSSVSSVWTIDSDCEEEETWAVKMLSLGVLKCPKRVHSASNDLLNEVEILSELPFHPNIIKIRGVSADFFKSPAHGFLVLEYVFEPLSETMHRWRNNNNNDRVSENRTTTVRSNQARRIRDVSLGLANAMVFLHQQRVLFRDLKPANIGLKRQPCHVTAAANPERNVRLFDFGLARKVGRRRCSEKQQQQQQQQQHKPINGRVGTLRYMAPEVARKENYSFPADVYSFGMLLWEVCMLEAPFAAATTATTLNAMVTRPDIRSPPLAGIASPSVRELIRACWHTEPSVRPCFKHVLDKLRAETRNFVVVVEEEDEGSRCCTATSKGLFVSI